MQISKQRLSVISDAADGAHSVPPSGMRRDVALAVIFIAILLLGMVVGSVSTQPGAAAAGHVEIVSPQPSNDFVYFPSQFVNQGTEMPETPAQF